MDISSNYNQILRCYYQNVRGLNTKFMDFFISASSEEIDLIFVTETWFTEDVFNTELFPAICNVCRCDRELEANKVSKGSGVLIAVKNRINVFPLDLSNIVLIYTARGYPF